MADASPASLYARSDDEEASYQTIAQAEMARGIKLLFCKSKVYLHPTASAKDNISGYMALLEQRSAVVEPEGSSSPPSSAHLLLAWLPDCSLVGSVRGTYAAVDLAAGDDPPRQPSLVPPPPTMTTHSGSVTASPFAVPLSAVYSLQVRPPNLGWWYGSMVINSRAGQPFPALFFHDNECQSTMLQKKKRARDSFDPFGEAGQMFWGADEVLRWLRRYLVLERSALEPNMYLVEPSSEDLAALGSGSQLGAPGPAPGPSRRDRGPAAAAPGVRNANSQQAEADPLVKFVRETGWNIMNQLSKVTTFTRRAAQDLVDNSNMPPQVRRLLRNPEVQHLQQEFDSARIYLARWARGIAEQGERDRRARVWTDRDLMELEATEVGSFELLATSVSREANRNCVKMAEWQAWFEADTGRLSVTVDEVRERIFHGGLDANDGVRPEAWLFLLGVYEWQGTAEERRAQLASLRDQYYRLKQAWWERLDGDGGEGEEGEWWREQRARIEKDVHRTDRNVSLFQGEDSPHPDPNSPFAEAGTNAHLEQMKEMLLTYNEYNKELGYVQGMSDLLAPLYAVLQDDAIAFWAFAAFMDRMEANFRRDQSGMRRQLLVLDQLVRFMDPALWAHLQAADSTNFFFLFRMILVWYKREFAWADVLRLWETLWSDHLTAHFHLFIALAILDTHRDVMMNHLRAFDEVLKYVNELSNTMDLESILIRAEALFLRFARLVEAVDKQENFPGPRALDGSRPGPVQDKVVTAELRQLLSRTPDRPAATVAAATTGKEDESERAKEEEEGEEERPSRIA